MLAEALVAHLVGDYVIQSDWMASEKTKRWWPAVVHAVTYTLPFLLLTRSPVALLLIAGTHAVIDRYRLARYVSWAKNQLGPRRSRVRWADAQPVGATGYDPQKPLWLTFWLLIVTDNVMHVLINYAALRWTA